jgi:hypothetical protein
MQARRPGQWVDVGDNDNDLDVTSTPLGDDDVVVRQENVAGKDNIRGGGEFPDPDTPPDESLGAPGDDLQEVRARDNTSS